MSGGVSARDPALPVHPANGYGLLRLVMASLVIVQHSLYLTGFGDYAHLGGMELGRRATYGDVAVGGFFVLSGFLLASSVRRHSPTRFLRLRFFRLFPGFWATLFVVAFFFAPLIAWVGDRPGSYSLWGPDSAVGYVVKNAGLLILQPSIGAVLVGNPFPEGLDGSLWTLAPEFLCYLGLLTVTIVGRRLGLRGWIPPAAAATASAVVFVSAAALWGDGLGLTLSALAALGLCFFLGSAVGELGATSQWLWRWRHVSILGLGLAVALWLGLWLPLGPPLLAGFVISLGACLRSGWPSRVGTRADISYGVYLYHFPVIQAMVAAGLGAATAMGAAVLITPLAWLLTLPFAAGSWYLVEAPAQRWGRRRAVDAQSAAQELL